MISTGTSARAVAPARLPLAFALAALAAVLGNLVLFALAPKPLSVMGPGGALADLVPGMVVGASVAGALAATLVLALLSRFARRPLATFQLVAMVALLLSLVPVLTMPIAASTKLVLALMHVVAAGAIVTVLSRFGRAA